MLHPNFFKVKIVTAFSICNSAVFCITDWRPEGGRRLFRSADVRNRSAFSSSRTLPALLTEEQQPLLPVASYTTKCKAKHTIHINTIQVGKRSNFLSDTFSIIPFGALVLWPRVNLPFFRQFLTFKLSSKAEFGIKQNCFRRSRILNNFLSWSF